MKEMAPDFAMKIRILLYLLFLVSWSCSLSVSDIAVIGGGSSGVFAAIAAVEELKETLGDDCSPCVTIYEASNELLHGLKEVGKFDDDAPNIPLLGDTSKKPRELLGDGYPRGKNEIASIMTKGFSPIMQRSWFEEKGIKFQTERDGSVVALDPEMVAAALEHHEVMRHIIVKKLTKVIGIKKRDSDCLGGQFEIKAHDRSLTIKDEVIISEHECVILATGNSFQGQQIAKYLGHECVAPMRSMFGFLRPSNKAPQDPQWHLLEDLSPSNRQIVAPYCRVSFKQKNIGKKRPRVIKTFGSVQFGASGSGMVGHYVAGNAPLKLSSNAAKELKDCNFKGTISIHFCPEIGQVEEIYERLWEYRQENPHEQLANKCPLEYREIDYDNYDFETDTFAMYVADCVPPEIWGALCRMTEKGKSTIETKSWGSLSPKKVRSLADLIVACPFDFDGKYVSPSRGGCFVNAGGVSLKELEMTTMASKLVSGLFYCGKILNVDGSSTEYNRMIDWATGHTAGVHAAKYILSNSPTAERGRITIRKGNNEA